MNIIEAIKSGRPYGRKKWGSIKICRVEGFNTSNFSEDDLIADDWEIEEEKIEISRSQIEKAFFDLRVSRLISIDSFNDVLKKLGF